MSGYREPGQVDRGEPAGFPLVPPVQRAPIRVPPPLDSDVVNFEAKLRSNRWAWLTLIVALLGGGLVVALSVFLLAVLAGSCR